MIGYTIRKLLLQNEDTFITPAQNVANVSIFNPLYHAMLVLTQVKYSTIPVLDKGDRFVGLVSLANVMEKVLERTSESFNPEELKDLVVADVMEVNVPTITDEWAIEEVLSLLIDYAFLPVVNEKGRFTGILTRKEMLKAVNYMAHELEKQNVILPKTTTEQTEKVKLIIQ